MLLRAVIVEIVSALESGEVVYGGGGRRRVLLVRRHATVRILLLLTRPLLLPSLVSPRVCLRSCELMEWMDEEMERSTRHSHPHIVRFLSIARLGQRVEILYDGIFMRGRENRWTLNRLVRKPLSRGRCTRGVIPTNGSRFLFETFGRKPDMEMPLAFRRFRLPGSRPRRTAINSFSGGFIVRRSGLLLYCHFLLASSALEWTLYSSVSACTKPGMFPDRLALSYLATLARGVP